MLTSSTCRTISTHYNIYICALQLFYFLKLLWLRSHLTYDNLGKLLKEFSKEDQASSLG